MRGGRGVWGAPHVGPWHHDWPGPRCTGCTGQGHELGPAGPDCEGGAAPFDKPAPAGPCAGAGGLERAGHIAENLPVGYGIHWLGLGGTHFSAGCCVRRLPGPPQPLGTHPPSNLGQQRGTAYTKRLARHLHCPKTRRCACPCCPNDINGPRWPLQLIRGWYWHDLIINI